MVLNEAKSKYIVFSRAQADLNTRLVMNNVKLDQVHAARLLGVLLTDDLKFEQNTNDICKRGFARISMITKLKFVGVGCHDLVDTHTLFIRSVLEYCSVSRHSSLTKHVQSTALKVILGEYEDYEGVLVTCNL